MLDFFVKMYTNKMLLKSCIEDINLAYRYLGFLLLLSLLC
jgi:hypothetical protein